MEKMVNTVLGPVSTAKLGVTLIHEHLKVAYLGWDMDPFNTFDRASALRKAVENMKEIKELGVSTIVDPLPMGLGRDPEFDAEVSQKSGVQVIISTGIDLEGRAMPPYFTQRSTNEIAAVYVSDLTRGIGDTGVKAGIIKGATSQGQITANEQRALRAAARASLETGAPIVTHTSRATMGPEQADIFLSEGLSPKKFMIGHCCHSTEFTYLKTVLDKGSYMGFDQIGLTYAHPDEDRLFMLTGLLSLGYAGRLLLSQDHFCCIVGADPKRLTHMATIFEKNRHSVLFREFLPRLRKAGVSEQTITQMLVTNPRDLFEAPAKA